MFDQKSDPNRRPRRALSNAERGEIFREFKLGLFALGALVILVVTLAWDRGGSAGAPDPAAQEPNRPVIQVNWQPPRPILGGDDTDRSNPPGRDRGDPAPAPPNLRQAPPAPPAPPPRAPFRQYVVRKGDTSLWKIAARELGDGAKWLLIKDANPGLNAKRLRIGQVLRIPSRAEAPVAVAAGGVQVAQGGPSMFLDAPSPPADPGGTAPQ